MLSPVVPTSEVKAEFSIPMSIACRPLPTHLTQWLLRELLAFLSHPLSEASSAHLKCDLKRTSLNLSFRGLLCFILPWTIQVT